MKKNKQLKSSSSLHDIKAGLGQYKVALLLSKLTMKAGFINTRIGPLWITLNALTYVLFFALVRNLFFGTQSILTDVTQIYIAFTLFTMSTAGIREGASTLIRHRVYLDSSAIPLTTLYLKVYFDIVRSSCYAIFVIPIVLLWSGLSPNWAQLAWIFVWFFIWSFMVIGMSIWLSVISLQLPDITPLLQSLLTGLMFMTPRWWKSSDIKTDFGITLVQINPFAWCIESISGVFYGSGIDSISMTKMLGFAVLNLLLGWIALSVTGRKIIYSFK